MAFFGHVSEFAIPIILLVAMLTGNPWLLLGGCILFTGFHSGSSDSTTPPACPSSGTS